MSVSPIAPQYLFFGDSLTDDGNLYTQSEGLLSDVFRDAASGFDGRASDGPTWAELLSARAGASYDIYAVAGAEAVGSQALWEFAISFGALDYILVPLDDPAAQWDMNLTAQIDRFQMDWAGADLSNTTSFILIGGNDYGALREVLPSLDPFQAVAALADTLISTVTATLASALELSLMGMDEVVIVSMPEAEFFPVIHATGAVISGLLGGVLDAHNDLLEAGVNVLSDLGANISFIDIGPITGAIADDTSQFGMTAPYDYFISDGEAAGFNLYDASQIAFWDDIHPSAQTHSLLSLYIATISAGTYAEDTGTAAAEGWDRSAGTDDTLALLMGGNDSYVAGTGDDLIFAGSGNDAVLGGVGNDLISGGAGANRLAGGADDDIIALGGSGSEADGGAGNDLMILQAGTNFGVARGGTGDDLFLTGLGTGGMAGGDGNDTFVIFVDHTPDMLTVLDQTAIDGGAGIDSVAIIGVDPAGSVPDVIAQILNITLSGVEELGLFDTLGAFYETLPVAVVAGAEWGLVPDDWTMLG